MKSYNGIFVCCMFRNGFCVCCWMWIKKCRELKLYARQDSVKYLIVPTTFYAISSTSYSRYCIYTERCAYIHTMSGAIGTFAKWIYRSSIFTFYSRFLLGWIFWELGMKGMLFGWFWVERLINGSFNFLKLLVKLFWMMINS